MSTIFNTAMDVEDAYYDAIDEDDLDGMMSVWADTKDIACLLPMQPIHHGREEIQALWKTMLDTEMKVDIVVNHLQWIELGDTAIHLLEEVVTLVGSEQSQPPIYATNVYHRGDSGWHLLLHLNSPAPMPPAGVLPPIPGT